VNDLLGVRTDCRAGALQVKPELSEGARGCRAAQKVALTAEERLEAVLSVLANRATGEQEALRCGVAETEVKRWSQLFIESGCRGLTACGRLEPQSSVTALAVRNAELKSELHRKLEELRSYCQGAHGELGPFVQVEEIRRESGIGISRFCVLIGVSRRTYFRRLALMRSGRPPRKEADSTSIVSTCAQLVERYVVTHPGYGHRRIHELMIADGHMVSASSVFRAIRIFQLRDSDSTAQGSVDLCPEKPS
jgi:transposase-like protein